MLALRIRTWLLALPLHRTSQTLEARSCSSVKPLRNRKAKSLRKETLNYFVDSTYIKAEGGQGGNGCVSFLRLWCNPNAGPDGGDGGNGGHVLLKASTEVKDFRHITHVLVGEPGEKGYNKSCHGRNSSHTIVKVPVGTVIKLTSGIVVGDLKEENSMFIAARGGAGGKGNSFFASDVNQTPEIAEYGADGEVNTYILELSSMANIGLIGFPNAGKSTLLQAISRARPMVAPYPFTTLHPHVGMVSYDDHEQIAVADLPGLIPDSHKNKGLGIEFLKHAERCNVLLFLLDASSDNAWEALSVLRDEIEHFNPNMLARPSVVVANKIDLPAAQQNLPLLLENINEPVIPVSAKHGTNLTELLCFIRKLHDNHREKEEIKDKTK